MTLVDPHHIHVVIESAVILLVDNINNLRV